MNDCLALFFTGSNGGNGSRSKTREERVAANLAAEIETRRQDIRHAQISVGVAKAAVADAYKQHGRSSQAFMLAVTKLRREQMREQTCSSVLSRLEDAQHMTQMREMTVSALTALKGTNLESNDFESLYSTADDHAAIAEEAKEQVAEIAQCFSTSGDNTDIDELLVELGLESKLDKPAQLDIEPGQETSFDAPSVPETISTPIENEANENTTVPPINM